MPDNRPGINDKEHVMSQNLISLELSDEDITASTPR